MSALRYSETPKFSQLLKQLTKRFRSLPDDLEIAKKAAIELRHVREVDNQSSFELQGYENQFCRFYKVKKFACKSLKGRGNRSGIRLIYASHPDERRVVLIEIYSKSDQSKESRDLLRDYLQSINDSP